MTKRPVLHETRVVGLVGCLYFFFIVSSANGSHKFYESEFLNDFSNILILFVVVVVLVGLFVCVLE